MSQSYQKETKKMQPQQQPPNTPPIYIKHTNIGLPNHSIVLLLIAYMPNTMNKAY